MVATVSTQLGPYRLLDRVGVGGMAELFRATVEGVAGFERIVAIKRLLPHLTDDPNVVQMFIDEAKIAVQLKHANIAEILDLGCHDGQYFIAMEFVDGHDLRTLGQFHGARTGAGFPVAFAVHVVMRVCEALAHSHGAPGRDGKPLGFIHRDVSPQNILVSFDGHVKVIDFGLAKARGRMVLTVPGTVKGKLAYMSPEQGMGQPLDPRTDIYSLGISLYEMLTAIEPFGGLSQIETLLAIENGEVPPLRSLAPAIPADLEAIVERMIAKDREARYAAAGDAFDALEAFAYGHGLAATQPEIARFVTELSAWAEQPGALDRPLPVAIEWPKAKGPLGDDLTAPAIEIRQAAVDFDSADEDAPTVERPAARRGGDRQSAQRELPRGAKITDDHDTDPEDYRERDELPADRLATPALGSLASADEPTDRDLKSPFAKSEDSDHDSD